MYLLSYDNKKTFFYVKIIRRMSRYAQQGIGYTGVDDGKTSEQLSREEANARVILQRAGEEGRKAKIMQGKAEELAWRQRVAAEQAVSLGEGVRRKSALPRAAGGMAGGNAPYETGCVLKRGTKVTDPAYTQTTGQPNEGSAVMNAKKRQAEQQNEVIEEDPENRAQLAKMGIKRTAKDTLNSTLQGGLFGCATGALMGAIEGLPAAGATMGVSVLGGMAIGCYSGVTTGAAAGAAIGLAGGTARGLTEQALFDEKNAKASYKKGSEAGRMVEQGVQTAAMIYGLYQSARQIGRGIKYIRGELKQGKTVGQSVAGYMGQTPMADEFFRNNPGIGYNYGSAFYGGKPEDLARLEKVLGYQSGALFNPTPAQYRNMTGKNQVSYNDVRNLKGKELVKALSQQGDGGVGYGLRSVKEPSSKAMIGKKMQYNEINNQGMTPGQRLIQKIDNYRNPVAVSRALPKTAARAVPPELKVDTSGMYGEQGNAWLSPVERRNLASAMQRLPDEQNAWLSPVKAQEQRSTMQGLPDDGTTSVWAGTPKPMMEPLPEDATAGAWASMEGKSRAQSQPADYPDDLIRRVYEDYSPTDAAGSPIEDEIISDAFKNLALTEKMESKIVKLETQLEKGKMSSQQASVIRSQIDALKAQYKQVLEKPFMKRAVETVMKAMPDRLYMSKRINAYTPGIKKGVVKFVKKYTGGFLSTEAGDFAEALLKGTADVISMESRPQLKTIFGAPVSQVKDMEISEFYNPAHKDSNSKYVWSRLFEVSEHPHQVHAAATEKIRTLQDRAGAVRRLSEVKRDEELMKHLQGLTQAYRSTLPKPTPMHIDSEGAPWVKKPVPVKIDTTTTKKFEPSSQAKVTTPTTLFDKDILKTQKVPKIPKTKDVKIKDVKMKDAKLKVERPFAPKMIKDVKMKEAQPSTVPKAKVFKVRGGIKQAPEPKRGSVTQMEGVEKLKLIVPKQSVPIPTETKVMTSPLMMEGVEQLPPVSKIVQAYPDRYFREATMFRTDHIMPDVRQRIRPNTFVTTPYAGIKRNIYTFPRFAQKYDRIKRVKLDPKLKKK